ncbi:RidA family protein [Actinomadura algeriensis]|uniref:Enamine deaminase RidA (YjgF/YER057c/UK114 family) n=1 Tax=Actinomadura algeriensis TaxID=1679523 RepID=A0ABR9K237_9ACTN|nr:Rid family hydrolase [Actinomadura algeriensis]MBE1536887.1 enamine deaminase RidA (YjgF/YER057c/UK114 family) [Actinomadura algeriensis]
MRAGRTLFMSGFAALDMETQKALYPGDVEAQAEVTYGAVLRVLEHAGLGPADLLSSVEFCVAPVPPDHRGVAAVRQRLLRTPPVSTRAACAALLRPEFLLEVFPTALYPAEECS